MIRDIRMILTRLFTVALLMMISIAAGAQVKVLYGKDGEAMKADEKGTIVIPQKEQKEPLEGGTITITQEKPTDGKVRVNFYVVPASGYVYNDGNITLVAFIPLSSTRADNPAEDITVHSTLTLTPKDKSQTDTSKPRAYYVDIDEGLGLWVQKVKFKDSGRKEGDEPEPAPVAPDYSGTYYIASNYKTPNSDPAEYNYDDTTLDNNYYLCPTDWKNWCTYKKENSYFVKNTDSNYPFLTTFKCRTSDYVDLGYTLDDAKWIITKHPTENYYYIQHCSDNKYLMFNGQISGTSNADRMRVHLEAVTGDPGENALFSITADGSSVIISPKSIPADHLTVNGGNTDYLYGEKNEGQVEKTGGPKGYTVTNGIIGIYRNNKTDDAKYLYLEEYIKRPTIVYNSSNLIEITPAQSGDVAIKYTTDGTVPSAENGETYSDPFDPADGVTTIMAVTIVGNEVSNVATLQRRLIQNQNNGWTVDGSTTDFHFYMTQGDDASNITKVNTTSLFRPSMEWYFIDAENGYKYIANASNHKYLCYDATNGVYMADYTNDNKYKFNIKESPTAGTFNIYPYGQNILIYKNSGNTSPNAIVTVGYSADNANSGNARWKFILPANLDKDAPFTAYDPSTNSYSYYKIANVGGSGYYIVPGTTYVETSNSEDDAVVNTMNWYFEVAQEATSSDWLTYYHIRNAVTGDYLFFTKDENNKNDCLEMRSTIESGNEDRYMFTWAKTADTNVNYYIIPKKMRDASLNYFSSLRKADSNEKISTNVTRGAGTFAWKFSPSTFKCANPVITYDATQGTATITCATLDAKIYYVCYTDDTGADPDLTGDKTGLTLYDGTPIDMSGYSYIKARAARSGDGTDQSASVSEGPITAFRCATPVIKLSGGKISITCATTVATIYYTVNQEIDATNPLNTTGIQTYSAPFPFDGTSVIRAIAIKGEILSNKSDVATYDKVLHKITKSSAITEMAGNYYFDEGFEDDRTDAIGTDATPFTGTIDGGYHAFSLSHPLIGVAQDATIMNVMISSAEISTTGKVGAIAGEARGYTRIYNCGILPNDATNSNPSTVASTDSYCGGLVGWLKDDSRVVNCFSYANITGGTDVAGIVGHVEAVSGENGSDATVSEGKYVNLRSAVVNCMFYGDITGGSQIYPVYGGAKMLNTGANGINNYNFYRAKASINVGTRFNCSWPASEENLTRFEYYRYLLNSNREICGWWVNSDVAPNTLTTGEVQAIEKDASLIAKWVLDPSIAPYPVLKAPGKYPSVINQDPNKRINPETKAWVDRDVSDNTIETNKAPDTKGQTLGSVEVTIISGKGSNESRTIKITAMDTDNNDFCYGKIQLPYYNEIFGNPNSTTWSEKYGGNYMSSVVTGWDITTTDGTPGTFSDDPITGNIFADRNSTAKDTHRVFAQGGYYYVPYGVGSITITAHWATAYYLGNGADGYYDRVWFSNSQSGSAFAPAGTRSFSSGAFGGKSVNNGTIQSVLISATAASTVYDCAIVLVGNHQYKNLTDAVDNAKKPFTIMSVDLDFDNEPDYCLEWQVGSGSTRAMVAPVRFDFLPVVELGVAMKEDASKNLFALGKLTPYGHFEVTETSVIHFGQFEYENKNRTIEAPVILNNGVFDQICRGTDGTDNQHISYFLLGGHVKMPSFTPGAHVTKENSNKSRHCAVNVLGGEFTKFYLTGNYNNGVTPNDDDPHCYIDGGKLDMVASAAKEGITGSVYWKIDHAYIGEFYGGGISSDKRVTGNIEIKIDRSKVTKFCGGPMFGDMNDGQTVTTTAIGTTFGVYYGAGNGGTCYSQYSRTENTNSFSLSNYTATKYEEKINNVTGMNGYHAKYEFELVNTSAGTDNSLYYRTYLFAAQFATTNTGDVSNTLTDCTIETNFFGGGNLGGVTGSVTSELKGHTVVEGNAYGAGYSAKDLSVDVLPQTGYTAPKRDTYTAVISDPVYPDPTPYVWTNEPTIGSTSLSTSSPTASSGNINYLFTEVPLVNLGAVSQNVSLTIGGTSEVHQNVFGGGEESGVDGNTTITLKEGAQIGNNVFGGGNNGVVSGSATVNIE